MPDYFQGVSAPASGAFDITIGVAFAKPSRAIYVGGAGDVTVTFIDGTTSTFKNVPAGVTLAVRGISVNAGSSATYLVGLL